MLNVREKKFGDSVSFSMVFFEKEDGRFKKKYILHFFVHFELFVGFWGGLRNWL